MHTRSLSAWTPTLALSILATPRGAIVDEAEFPTTSAGLARAVARVGRRTGDDLEALWVIECFASYGAQLAGPRGQKAGYQVVEAPRLSARDTRGIGKSDPLYARRIAASVLALAEASCGTCAALPAREPAYECSWLRVTT